MAEAEFQLPPWDPQAPYTLSRDQCEDIIINNRFRWMKHLKLDAYFWSCLLELEVVNGPSLEEIQVSQIKHNQVFELLNHIEHGPPSRLHGLLRAMALTDQQHLVPEDILDREVYLFDLDDSDHNKSDVQFSPQLLRAIATHCRYNIENQMKAHIFDFDGDSGDDFLDISQCHIEVTPEVNQERNSSKGEQSRRKTIPIPWRKVVETFDGSSSPKRIRCYGDPGVGKTMFGRNYAYTLSKEFLEKAFKDGKLRWSAGLPKWNTVVVLKARSISTAVEDSIQEELGCKHEDVELLMKHIQKGEGVILNIDGLDELRDESILKIIHNYLFQQKRKGGPVILITCRTDLADIDAQLFDRFITLEGFTMEQGIQYAKLYSDNFPKHMSPNPKHAIPLYDFVRQHIGKLEAIISNPLKYYIFCALAMRGEVELDDSEFSIPKLFRPLEKHLLNRAGGDVTKEHSQAFYKFCLHALLCDMREFSQEQLDNFNIIPAYMVFFNRRYTRIDGALEAQYSFSHEMILEFMASQYICNLKGDEQMSLVLVICGDRKLRNVQRILFEMLIQEGPNQCDLLMIMVQCMLVLQIDEGEYTPKSTFHSLLGLDKLNTIAQAWKKYRQTISMNEILVTGGQKFQTTQAKATIQKLTQVFEKHPDDLREAHWYAIANNSGTLDHIIQCLSACTHSYDFLILNTLAKIIPHPVNDTGGTCILRVRGRQDVTIMRGQNEVTISAQSPGDVVDALTQYMTSHLALQREVTDNIMLELNINRSNYQTGQQTWSNDKWHRLLRQLGQRWVINDELFIAFSDKDNLTGLLQKLPPGKQVLDIKVVSIHGGIAGIGDIICCATKCKKAEVRVEFKDTNIVTAVEADGLELKRLSWRDDEVSIYVDRKAKTTGQLNELSQPIEHLNVHQQIPVSSNKEHLHAVLSCAASFKQTEGKIELCDTNIVLTKSEAEGGKEVVEIQMLICTEDGLYVNIKSRLPSLLGDLQDVVQLALSCKQAGCKLTLGHTKTSVSASEQQNLKQLITSLSCLCQDANSSDQKPSTLTGLLQELPHHTEILGEEIAITNGTAELSTVLSCAASCAQARVKFELHDSQIVFTPGNVVCTAELENLTSTNELLHIKAWKSTGSLLHGLLQHPEYLSHYQQIMISYDQTADLQQVVRFALSCKQAGCTLRLEGTDITILPSDDDELKVLKDNLSSVQHHLVLFSPTFVINERGLESHIRLENEVSDAVDALVEGLCWWE